MTSDQRAFAIRLERSPIGVAVWVSGRLDIASAEAVHAAIVEASRHHPRVVIELSEVDSLDAAVLGALVGAAREAGDDTAIILRRPSPLVSKMLGLTQLDDVFEIES